MSIIRRVPLLFAFVVALMATAAPTQAATFVVNTVNDTDDGACNAAHCSLREAVGAANAAPGSSIEFNIPAAAAQNNVFTIRIATGLLWIVADGTTIDGATQTTFGGNTNPLGPEIVLDGSLLGDQFFGAGLLVNASNCTVRSLVVNNFISAAGVGIAGGNGFGLVSTGNRVEGCYLGTDPTGTTAAPNALGVAISGDGFTPGSGATQNIIGGQDPAQRNLISGNTGNNGSGNGISLSGSETFGNRIEGNYIGTTRDGEAALANGYGMTMYSGAHDNIIGGTSPGAGNIISGNQASGVYVISQNETFITGGNIFQGNYVGTDKDGESAIPNATYGIWCSDVAQRNVIGGLVPGAGNVISGNGSTGVNFTNTGRSFNLVQGNLIGTNKDGTAAVPNGDGVLLSAGCQENRIGGTEPGARNIISGNLGGGVTIYNSNTEDNVVQGNYIGTDVTGLIRVPNGPFGYAVSLQYGAHRNLIGGATPAARNIISGNDTIGITLGSTIEPTSENIIQGNYIGTDVTGQVELHNTSHGIECFGGAIGNIIGGINPGEGNRIAFNQGDAVRGSTDAVGDSGGNTIRGNTMFSNVGLGINLRSVNEDAFAVTSNDANDADTGPNRLQNFPLITAIAPSGGSTTLTGSLSSTPNRTFTLDFYYNRRAHASGYGEGEFYLGSQTVSTDGTGHAGFTVSAQGNFSSQVFTATATDNVTGDTSEFSPARAAISIIGFTPGSGLAGTVVTITGTNFTGAAGVAFNGVSAGTPGSGFSVDSDTQITATVPAGALTGPITITTPTGAGSSTTNFVVTAPPANDNFSAAEQLNGSSSTSTGHNFNATAQTGEPDHAGGGGGALSTGGVSVWYSWQTPTAGEVTFDTNNSDIDTLLGVYTGSAVNALTRVASDDDSGDGATSRVVFPAAANVPYFIAIDGFNGAQGVVNLNWNLTIGPPNNDDFANAQVIVGNGGGVVGANVLATLEGGEPPHAANPGGKSVWYRWTPDVSGPVEFDTAGTEFDNLLAVYTGTSLVDIVAVASNFDNSGRHNSAIHFDAVAGTTYHIAVDGARSNVAADPTTAAQGNLQLNWFISISSSSEIHWTNAAGGNWNVPGNWDLDRVPVGSDAVFIDLPGTYTVNLDTDIALSGLFVGAASGTQTLQNNTNTLIADGLTNVGAHGVLSLNGGNFSFNATCEVQGAFNWTAGAVGNAGHLFINAAEGVTPQGVLNLSGGGTKVLDIRALTNFGTINWSGAGPLLVQDGTEIANYRTFNVAGDAVCNRSSNGGPLGEFINVTGGTFTKTGGTGETVFLIGFSNDGTVHVQNGRLSLLAGGLSFGVFNIDTTGRIEFSADYRFDKGNSTFQGAGIAGLSGGTASIEQDVATENFELSDGSIGGGADLSTNGTFRWLGGAMTGKGSTTVEDSATMEIEGGGDKTLTERKLRNFGVIEWSGDGPLRGGGGAFILNQTGGTIAVLNRANITHSGVGAKVTITNNGLLDLPVTAALEIDGSYSQSAGNTQLAGGSLTCSTPLDIDAGLINGEGTIDASVDNGGTLDPAALSPAGVPGRNKAPRIGVRDLTTPGGLLTISGDLTQRATGRVNIRIGGVTDSQGRFLYGRISVGRNVNLGGSTLACSLVNFVPTSGQTFEIIRAQSITGDFGNMANGLAVGNGVTVTGQVVTNTGGASMSYVLTAAANGPAVTGFSPAQGLIGQSVAINGSNFTGATSVRINGTAATGFVVNGAGTQITLPVPAGATTGKITVQTPVGTATSAADFKVLQSGNLRFSTTAYTVAEDGGTATITVQRTGGGDGAVGVHYATGAGTATAAADYTATAGDLNWADQDSAPKTFTIAILNNAPNEVSETIPLTLSAPTGSATLGSPAAATLTITDDDPLPAIASFTPASGAPGASVTINGTNLTRPDTAKPTVVFNGTNVAAANVTVVSSTQIRALVPAGAATGKIKVTTSAGTATGATNFTMLAPAPTIASFTPTSGPVGTIVTVTGTNFTGATSVKLGAAAAAFTNVTATSLRATVPAGAISGKFSVTTPGGTTTSAANFTVTILAPTITSFTPTSGPTGAQVTVTGTNFIGATSVKINGITAAFTVVSATSLQTTIPATATSGKISVTTPGGTATSAGSLTVVARPTAPPVITSFTPASGKVGTVVTINGSAFVGITAVRFRNVSAIFSVLSTTQIRATVPATTTGVITVTNAAGTATSATSFTVPQPPVITTFNPISGPAGTQVTITGKNFTGATIVKFNNKATTSLTVLSDTQIRANVPVGTVTGPIAITTAAGVSPDTGKFQVLAPPNITTFSPASGKVGAVITIFGSNFTGLKELKFFNNKQPTIVLVTDTQIVVKVPAGASTGPISVATTRFPTLVPTKGSFFVLPGAPARSSTINISGAAADLATQTIRLNFSGALDAESAIEAAHYVVTVNGNTVGVEVVSYQPASRTITLGLPEAALYSGDQVMVQWQDLIDASGLAATGQAGPLVAR